MSSMDKHKRQLESLEAVLKAAQGEAKKQALLQILEKYPYLYGYWLKYLQEFYPTDRSEWLKALEVCPVLELWQQFLTTFPGNSEDFELAIQQVGEYFQAAPIWDQYLLLPGVDKAQILKRAIKMPLYDYAKYFSQAKDVVHDLDLATLGQLKSQEINERWAYESKIQRPYFHVLPLEQADLDNWNNYLDYQGIKQDQDGTALYRRCLVSTALYPEFWLRYLRYVGEFHPHLLDSVYSQAVLFIKDTPEYSYFAILYASYLEVHGRDDDAKQILLTLDDKSALDDFEYRHGGAQQEELSLEEARKRWKDKQLDKHKYLEILKANGELEEFFKVDIIVNGPPDAAKAMRKQQ